MERVELVSLSIQLVPGQIVPVKSESWIESWFLPEDVPLSDHVAGDSVLLVIADECSPDTINIWSSVKRALISPETLSIVEQSWLQPVLPFGASSHPRNLSGCKIHELSKLRNEHARSFG